MREVSEWAGHSNVAFTLTRYGGLFEDVQTPQSIGSTSCWASGRSQGESLRCERLNPDVSRVFLLRVFAAAGIGPSDITPGERWFLGWT